MPAEVYIPSALLRPYIASFIVTEEQDERSYRVLPDTGLVAGFQFQGHISRIDGATEIPLTVSGISGLSGTSRMFRNVAGTSSILVCFTEGGAAQFFPQPLHELFGESVSLDNFMLRSELMLLEEQLNGAADNKKRVACIERFFAGRLRNQAPDKLVLGALALIHKSRGAIRVSELMRQLHTSQSPLEKRFRQAVGTTPKKFAAIVRLKYLVNNYSPARSLTEWGYEGGFYDQAHFIKEFRTFTGETPEQFFKQSS